MELQRSGFCCQRSRDGVGAGCHLLVECVEGEAVGAYQFQAVDEVAGGFFFFYLLGYEPVEFSAGGVVVFLFGESGAVTFSS